MAYFSNGCEGEALDNQCARCPLGQDAPCPILAVQLLYNYDQIGNEKLQECLTVLVSDKTGCMMRPLIRKMLKEYREYREHTGQYKLPI